MIMRFLIFMAVGLAFNCSLHAQKDDPVLFTVEGTPVQVSEFLYIYTKTNGKNVDFSRASLQEYLDLYVKFKLKVQRARDMKLDTIPELIRELEGYRRQLADSYLLDKEVTEKLTREAYERAKQDVDISHILILLKKGASPSDTLKAYQKALLVKKRLDSGVDFAQVAKEFSEDKSAPRNGGYIGYVTVLFPKGFYNLETAAYTLPLGINSDPIRTSAGYHILKVHGRREARGEMEAAHLLLRKKDKDPSVVKSRIDSIYEALTAGANFEQLVKNFSEDKTSGPKGGYIGFFGISRYDRAFEDVAFSLLAEGEISKPVETNIGWHIIKRISKKGIQPYNIERSRLETKISKDDRHEQAKLAMLETIKRENNFTEYPEVLDNFVAGLADTFLTFKWKVPEKKSPALLFTLGEDHKSTLGDFTDYLGRSSRTRLSLGRKSNLKEAVNILYNKFVDEDCLKYQESKLENKYPEFKALMREYEEGILLFEATKMLVWDKASQDTVGLARFYEMIIGKYRWEERALTSTYRLSTEHQGKIAGIREFAMQNPPGKVLEKFNVADNVILKVEKGTYEKSRKQVFKEMDWKVNALSQTEENKRNRSLKFTKIEEIIPSGFKTLREARGYIVADYQDYLEKLWVEQLRKDYKVKIKNKEFENLIR